jgi:WhiB family redox-sensing transcriptional regulator
MSWALAPADVEWRLRAACRGQDPEIFFPARQVRGSVAQRSVAAKRICAGCTVADDCLDWAVRNGETWGIWGGLNELERRKLRPDR